MNDYKKFYENPPPYLTYIKHQLYGNFFELGRDETVEVDYSGEAFFKRVMEPIVSSIAPFIYSRQKNC